MLSTTLKRIGNSRAFIIPAGILKKHNVKEGATIYYEEKEDHLELHFFDGEAPSSFFAELREAAKLPGPAMSMEDIKSDRKNKEERIW